MIWTWWLAIDAFAVCSLVCLFHFIRLVKLGKPVDYSQKTGKIGKAIGYSFTGAMNPAKKESAFLHLPTYTAGILYHLGTFAAIVIFILILTGISPGNPFNVFLIVFFLITAICGTSILIKRIVNHELKALSNPDDYFSNILVTAFQFITALILSNPSVLPYYFILASILFFYLPVGKLKHTVYFFAARYHLGFFYGWRGVWPPK
jgi:nitrate reductase gamma subunit